MVAPAPAPAPGPTIGPNKAIASGLSGAIITVIVWGVDSIWGVKITPEVATALTTIVGTALVWLVPHGGQ